MGERIEYPDHLPLMLIKVIIANVMSVRLYYTTIYFFTLLFWAIYICLVSNNTLCCFPYVIEILFLYTA